MQQSDNPKNLVARNRIKIAYIPPIALAHLAHALMDGAVKYNAYNWREKSIALMEYISAAHRHLMDFTDGENEAQDSLCHHLGHTMACCAIMLDAIERKNAIDDRPKSGNVSELFTKLEEKVRQKNAARPITGEPNNTALLR